MKKSLRRLLACLLVMAMMSAELAALAEMVLPSALQNVGEQAFMGDASIERVVVPQGAERIESQAFANSSLAEIVLPSTLTFIAADAFSGCGDVLVEVPENCYAYDRCVELGLIQPLKITAQPVSQTVSEGETATFTVTAQGRGLMYQWQYRAGGAAEWASCSETGNQTASLQVAASLARSGYAYRCVVTDHSGKIVTSDAAVLTVASAGPVEAPASISVTPDRKNECLVIEWSKVSGAVGYEIYCNVESELSVFETRGELIATISDANTLRYDDCDVALSQVYYYRIKALAADGGKSDFSDVAGGSVWIAYPTPITATAEDDHILVGWGKVDGAAGYRIYRHTSYPQMYFTENRFVGEVSGGSTLSWKDYATEDNAGTTYYYRVKAVDTDGSYSTISPTYASATMPAASSPSLIFPPATISVTPNRENECLTITWSEVPGADSYELYRNPWPELSRFEAGATLVTVMPAGHTLSINDYNVELSEVYYYRVKAAGTDGRISEFSDVANGSVLIPYPERVMTTARDDHILVEWTQVEGAAGYRVYRHTSYASSNFTETSFVAEVSGGTTLSWKDYATEETAGNCYYYRVKAVDTDGSYSTISLNYDGGYMPKVVAKPETIDPPVVDEDCVIGTNGTITLYWQTVSNAAGYYVWRATSENGSYTKIGTVSSGSVGEYDDTGLTDGQTYYYKLQAYTAKGTVSSYSNIVYAKAINTDKPGGLVVEYPVISDGDGNVYDADTITDYDLADGALTLYWGALNATEYLVRVAAIDEVPDFTSAGDDQGDYGEMLVDWDNTTKQSAKLTVADMEAYPYLKIAVGAYGANNTTGSPDKWTVTGIRLVDTSTVAPEVRSVSVAPQDGSGLAYAGRPYDVTVKTSPDTQSIELVYDNAGKWAVKYKIYATDKTVDGASVSVSKTSSAWTWTLSGMRFQATGNGDTRTVSFRAPGQTQPVTSSAFTVLPQFSMSVQGDNTSKTTFEWQDYGATQATASITIPASGDDNLAWSFASAYGFTITLDNTLGGYMAFNNMAYPYVFGSSGKVNGTGYCFANTTAEDVVGTMTIAINGATSAWNKTLSVEVTISRSGSSGPLNAKRQAVVDRAYDWYNYTWVTAKEIVLHKGKRLAAGTAVFGLPYSLYNGGVIYTPSTYKSKVLDKGLEDQEGTYSGGKTPKYGADCTQLVWDCWAAGGFPYDRTGMVTSHKDEVLVVDWMKVQPGDALRLNSEELESEFGHIMLVVAVDYDNMVYTVIEQSSGAVLSSTSKPGYTQIGTRKKDYTYGKTAYSTHKLEKAYTPYRYVGFDQ